MSLTKPALRPAGRETAAPRPSAARGCAVVCERRGAETFRMRAVRRCPACRCKTDCRGW